MRKDSFDKIKWLVKGTSVVIMGVLFTFMIPLKSHAFDDYSNRVVSIGYYENETFQEGASENAIKSGYSYEYLQKLASYNGWKYKYVYGSWSDLYSAFENGEIDLLAGLGYSESRLDVMNYPDYAMGYESYYLFVPSTDSKITLDYSTLNGKKIGTIPGLLENAIRDWLAARDANAEIVLFDDVADRDKALANGTIDAFIGESASAAQNRSITPLVKIKDVNMYLCVAKERTDLLEELNETLASIDSKEPYYLNDLSKKYFSRNAVSMHITSEEEEWLESHEYTIAVGYLDNFLPYCGTDSDGNAVGIMVDVLKGGFSAIDLPKPVSFVFKPYNSTAEMIEATHNHEVEIMFPISNDIYFLEKNNLYHSSDVITSAMNLVYKDDPLDAEEGIIAINRNNQIQYNYASNYLKNNQIRYYDSVDDCIKAVVLGKADGTILSGLRATTLLKNEKYADLSYVELPHLTVKCFGVSTAHKGILPLVNQALNSLEENEALTFSFKYISHNDDYSIASFLRKHRAAAVFTLMLVLSASTAAIVSDRLKTQKRNLYFEFAYKDGLTKLFNRRAYEEDLDRLNQSMPNDLMCVSMDLTGLKKANDTYGHAAGDELISSAAQLISETLGKYGRIYRTGGDEYYGLLNVSKEKYDEAKATFDELCANWVGRYSDGIKIAVGAATPSEVETSEIMDVCKLADKRMYEAKSAWYRAQGIDRRGRSAAQSALTNLYTKILKVNLTDDSYAIMSADNNEQTEEKGFSDKISEWLMGFGKSGQVHPDDLDNYLKYTDMTYLKDFFAKGNESLSIRYRRKIDDRFRQSTMDIIPADDYSDDNQSVFLYVKAIER